MNIHKEISKIFEKATPEEWVAHAEKSCTKQTHDEVAAHREDELRLIIASLEAARVAVQEVYKALNRHNIPIDQMMICAEDCLTESIDEAYKKLKGRRPAGE
jgi:hypothetical protein